MSRVHGQPHSETVPSSGPGGRTHASLKKIYTHTVYNMIEYTTLYYTTVCCKGTRRAPLMIHPVQARDPVSEQPSI